MSTGRHIDKICAAAVLLALIVTILFMNGRALGIEAVPDGDDGDGQFTANDLDGSWDASSAARITLTGDGADIDGGGAYFAGGSVCIARAGRYILSGELTGGVVIDTDSGGKVWLLLDGADIHNEDGAALLVEQAEKVFITLAEGSENALSSGAEYSQEAVDANIDGTIYSRDDLTINGGGSLAVTAEYRHGIVCNDDFAITGGTVTIDAAQDGIHANDSARLCGMDLTVTAGDDGVTVSNDEGTGHFYMESGTLSIPACCEGVEAVDVTVAGGRLEIAPTDDGINASGGGEVRVVNDAGRDADGLDSNGSIFISGGSTFLSVNGSGGNCALDAGTESGGVCQITGGTVVAAGGSAMAEGFDSSSTQGFLMQTVSGGAGTAVELRDSAGGVLLSAEIPCSFTSLVLSAPGLAVGDTCTLAVGGTETEVTIDNSAASGMGGMFGGRGRMMGGMAPDFAGRTDAAGLPGQEGREMPDAPAGQFPEEGGLSGQPQMPGRGDRQEMPDGQQGLRPDRDWMAAAPAGETAGVDPEALLLVGLSALVLAAGLMFAFKIKH